MSRGIPGPFTLTARSQTQGRGSHGRQWISDDNGGLYYSLAMSEFDPRIHSNLTIEVAKRCQRIIHSLWGLPITIEWPNDLILGNKKMGGILVESTIGSSGQPGCCIIGIGLNINQTHFPDPIDTIATSLRQYDGHVRSLSDLANELTKELVGWL